MRAFYGILTSLIFWVVSASAQSPLLVSHLDAQFQWDLQPFTTENAPESHVLTCGGSSITIPMPATSIPIRDVVTGPGTYTCTLYAQNTVDRQVEPDVPFPVFQSGYTPGQPFQVEVLENAQDVITVGHIQSTNTDNGYDNNVAATLTGTAAGNLLVVAVTVGSSSDIITSVNGSVNGAYTRATWAGVSGVGLHVYYKANGAGGNETVTVTFSASQSSNLALHEYSGIATTAALDQANAAGGTGTTSTDGDVSPSVTTTTAGQLIFSAIINNTGSTPTFTAGTSYTRRQHGPRGTDAGRHGTEDQIQSAAGSIQGTWTASTTDNYIAAIATFKALGGGGAKKRILAGLLVQRALRM